MKKLVTSLLFVSLSSSCLFSQSNVESICNGEVLRFESKILKEKKRIFVHLPNDSKNKSYPVIYLITSAPSDFRADICQGQFIVIGIENNDTKKYFIGEPNRDKYLNFLENELIPYVEKEYNASKIRFIAGHSISGAFVMDIFNRLPNTFSFYIATSPTTHILNLNIGTVAFSKPVYLYFNMGSKENYEQLENANRDLFKTLDSIKIKNLKWKYEMLADETHETNEFTGFCRGYNFYKSFSTIPDSLLSKNIYSIIEYVNNLSSQLGNKIEIGENIFMPNILINLKAQNYDNVFDALKYIAEANTNFVVEESNMLIKIVDDIRNNGNYKIARQAYQLIYNKIKSESVFEKMNELDKKK
jgi:hypothetical protein